jgi:DNA-binding NtrC family response regulator
MKTVLVVDDESLIRWSLCQALKDHFLVFTAASVDEALDIMGRARVDAVVTDLRMPERDGLDLVEVLRDRHPGVEVFVLTAYASDSVVRHLSRRGVRACIPKPFDVGQVKALLERELGPTAACPA